MSASDPITPPMGWTSAPLATLVELNPRRWTTELTDDEFVPMAAVEASTGRLESSQVRSWRDVKKGYTTFQDGDFLFAKIRPCMENGKFALATGLIGGRGAGSTEYHVLRPTAVVHPRLLLHFLLQRSLRAQARAEMKGAAGQLRVPAKFFEDVSFPLPPLPEQHRIVAAIEQQFTRPYAAVADLRQARTKLKRCRAAVLAAACSGHLVPSDNGFAQADDQGSWSVSSEERPAVSWKPTAQDHLPKDWGWTTVEGISTAIVDCPHSTPSWTSMGRICVRTTEFRPGWLDLVNARCVSEDAYQQRTRRLKPEEGDILYSREGGILGIACMVLPNVDICLGQRMMLIRIGQKALPSWVTYVLNSPLILGRVRSLTGGSASPHLNVRDVKLFPIPVPPLDLQQHIVAEVERNLSVVDEMEATVAANLKRAERMRQAILRRAFAGQLVPPDPRDELATAPTMRIHREQTSRLVSETRTTVAPATRHSEE